MYQISQLPSIILNDETLTVVREDTTIGVNTTYVDGKPVKANPIVFTVTANVQPLGGRDLMLVPEGDRQNDQFMVWATPSAQPLQLNDKIQRDGKAYQVQAVEEWECYYKARIQAVDVVDQTPFIAPPDVVL